MSITVTQAIEPEDHALHVSEQQLLVLQKVEHLQLLSVLVQLSTKPKTKTL